MEDRWGLSLSEARRPKAKGGSPSRRLDCKEAEGVALLKGGVNKFHSSSASFFTRGGHKAFKYLTLGFT